MTKPQTRQDTLQWTTADGEPPGALREALGVAREDDVSSEQVARLAMKLAPVLGVSIIAASAVTAVALQSGAGLAPAAAKSSVGWFAAHAATLKVLAVVLAVVVTAVSLGVMGGVRSSRVPAPKVVANVVSSSAANAPSTPIVPTTATTPTAPAAPQVMAPMTRTVVATELAAKPAVGVEPRKPSKQDLPNEARLLAAAQSVMNGDATHALRLVEEHRRAYPDGALAEEREVLAMQALARLGRADDARARLRKFHHRFPKSTQALRVEALLSADTDP